MGPVPAVPRDCLPRARLPGCSRGPGLRQADQQLRNTLKKLEELHATLLAMQPEDELRVLHTQLLASIGALKDESSHNADVLDEAAEPAEGENVGTLNKGKLRTLTRGRRCRTSAN